MSRRYAVQSTMPPGDLLSWHGRVLVHDNRAELEYLLTGDIKIVDCPKDIPPEQTLSIRHHPQYASVRWPLNRRQFR